MLPTYQLQRLTPLRISLTSNSIRGTGVKAGEHIIPYTDYALTKLCIDHPPIPEPPIENNVAEEHMIDLRPYQQEDIRRLINRYSSANFSEPRTGKTPTALRLFKAKGLKKVIVVAPASSLYQWSSEVKKWNKQKAEVITPLQTITHRVNIIKTWGVSFQYLIISYDSLKVTQRTTTNMLTIIKSQKDIDGIIVDEGHRIRNHKTQQAKAIFALKDIPNKHVLTGTPAHGRLENVYSILHFLYPQIFTGYWNFINYYFNIHTQRNYGQQTEFVVIDGLQNPHELPQFLSRISVQHKQIEVMPWLQEKDIIEIKLPATKEQRKYIKLMQEEFEVGNVIAENVLTQLMRIRQITNAPALLELSGKSPKIEWLKSYLEDYPDTPTIIFSNFTSFLKMISKELNLTDLIIGETSSKKREELRNDFQNGKIKVLLINTQAGKEALTLDKAESAIFLDTYPPYGDVEQAENRFVNTLQDVRKENSSLYRVMLEETYDEELYKLVQSRASETDILNNYKRYLKGGGAYDCI